jgi:hypothetical protein
MSAPQSPSDLQRPVRRVETDHGVTVLTNSTREPSESVRRPTPPPRSTHSLPAPAAVTLTLPDEPLRASETVDSSGSLLLAILLVLVLVSGTKLALLAWHRWRTQRAQEELVERDQTRISVPPQAPLSVRARKRKAAQAPQWASQPPSGKRTGT